MKKKIAVSILSVSMIWNSFCIPFQSSYAFVWAIPLAGELLNYLVAVVVIGAGACAKYQTQQNWQEILDKQLPTTYKNEINQIAQTGVSQGSIRLSESKINELTRPIYGVMSKSYYKADDTGGNPTLPGWHVYFNEYNSHNKTFSFKDILSTKRDSNGSLIQCSITTDYWLQSNGDMAVKNYRIKGSNSKGDKYDELVQLTTTSDIRTNKNYYVHSSLFQSRLSSMVYKLTGEGLSPSDLALVNQNGVYAVPKENLYNQTGQGVLTGTYKKVKGAVDVPVEAIAGGIAVNVNQELSNPLDVVQQKAKLGVHSPTYEDVPTGTISKEGDIADVNAVPTDTTGTNTNTGTNITVNVPAADYSRFFETAVVTLDFSPLTGALTNLKSVFPFSIPWDIYNLFAIFNAEAVVPRLGTTIDFMGNKQDFYIDLEGTENYMKVFRVFELVLFCYFLARKTKSIVWS